MALQNFKIDQAATFAGVIYLQCEPKTAFGTDRQDTLKDGTPKWEVQVLGAFRDQFGKVSNEVVKIGVAAHKNPGEGIQPYTPVELRNFEVGVMEKTKKLPSGEEKVIGVTVWFRAESLRSTADTGTAAAPATGSRGKAA